MNLDHRTIPIDRGRGKTTQAVERKRAGAARNRPARHGDPALRVLSLGAGVQSTAVLLLACDGVISPFDAALFADTGWEPAPVYEHLNRLRGHALRHGIPVLTVSSGNIRDDALDPERRFASMPLHVVNPDGSRGMGRRQCTNEYKIRPLKAATRELLGYPHPKRIPRGVYAEQAIGISTDEFHRAKDADVAYLRNVFPLLDLGMSRQDCVRYLEERGFANTPKSACLGCPFSGNARWRWLRETDPEGWQDAVDFDRRIRDGYARANSRRQPLRGRYYLHRSGRPLDEVDLTPPATRGHLRIVDEESDPDGCSPWACRSGTAVQQGSQDSKLEDAA